MVNCHYVLSRIHLLKQACMNLAVARITTRSANDYNCISIFSWFILWISGIILEQVSLAKCIINLFHQ